MEASRDYIVIRTGDELEIQLYTEVNVKNLKVQHYEQGIDFVIVLDAKTPDKAKVIGERMLETSEESFLEEPIDEPKKHIAVKKSDDVSLYAHTDELEERLDKEGWVRGMHYVVLEDMPDTRTAEEEARRQLGVSE